MVTLYKEEISMSIGVNNYKKIISAFLIMSVIAFFGSTFNLINLTPFNHWFYSSSSLLFLWLYLNPEIGQSNIKNIPSITQTKAWYLLPISGVFSALASILT